MKPALLNSDQTRQRAMRLLVLYLASPVLAFLAGNALLFLLCFTLHFGHAIRTVYGFNTLVMPALFLLNAGMLFRLFKPEALGRWARRTATAWAIAAILLIAARVYATHIEPRLLQVREVRITSEKLQAPLTILHISDIQSAGIGAYEKSVFRKIQALDPDIVLHTGDILQPIPPRTYWSELPEIAALFETLKPPLGMFMVQGDTCGPIYQVGPERTGGIAYLRNESTTIQRDQDRIRIYGLDLGASAFGGHSREAIGQWLQSDPSALNLVLGHRPDYILKLNDLTIDLCLAGHTHGGQIRVPFFGPPVIFSHIPRKWARGFHQIGNTHLNVSAGIGAEHANSLPSIRVNCPPEMTLIRIVPEG